jgi:hypothetical protein
MISLRHSLVETPNLGVSLPLIEVRTIEQPNSEVRTEALLHSAFKCSNVLTFFISANNTLQYRLCREVNPLRFKQYVRKGDTKDQ